MILSYKVFGKDRNLLNHKLNTKEIQTDLAKPNSEQCQASWIFRCANPILLRLRWEEIYNSKPKLNLAIFI